MTQGFRWNNYINRFHQRHTDLMDVLAGYEMRAAAPLDDIASPCWAFPARWACQAARSGIALPGRRYRGDPQLL